MSMHLVGPWLTTTGKKKGKKKWKSAEHKRKAEEYQRFREEMDRNNKKVKPRDTKSNWTPSTPFRRVETNIPSLNSSWNPCLKKETVYYTGDRLKGIAVMHKSNLVPIFNDSEAIEVAHMRR